MELGQSAKELEEQLISLPFHGFPIFKKILCSVLFQSYHRATREGQVLIYDGPSNVDMWHEISFVFSILILSWVHSGYVSCDITTN